MPANSEQGAPECRSVSTLSSVPNEATNILVMALAWVWNIAKIGFNLLVELVLPLSKRSELDGRTQYSVLSNQRRIMSQFPRQYTPLFAGKENIRVISC